MALNIGYIFQLSTGTTSSPAFTSRVAALTATAPQSADFLNMVAICPTTINSATAKFQ
jgi:hypothetical protein